jgi:hypothetical protein
MKFSTILFTLFTSAAIALPLEDGAVEDDVSIVCSSPYSSQTERILTISRLLAAPATTLTAAMPGPANARMYALDMEASC